MLNRRAVTSRCVVFELFQGFCKIHKHHRKDNLKRFDPEKFFACNFFRFSLSDEKALGKRLQNGLFFASMGTRRVLCAISQHGPAPDTALGREAEKAVVEMIRVFLSLVVLLGTATVLFAEGIGKVDQGAEAPAAVAAPTGGLNTGDQAWMLASSALVLLMTPGLAFFYGGLVGRKNVLSILVQCYMCMSLVTVLWVLIGFSMAFSGDDKGTAGFMGNPLTYFLLDGVTVADGWKPVDGVTLGISQQTFMVFQMMFAIITPALIIGAFAERMKFVAFMLFVALWSLLVYSPVAHWVWYGPDSTIFGLGAFDATSNVPTRALDFAGGTVVHINAGIAALVACLVIGPRRGYPKQINPPHNLPFAVLGAGLLWFGWFGFNGGSAFGATSQAVQAFVTTQVAAAMAGLTWSLLELVRNGKPTALGLITGVVAGLVGITPAAGFVDVQGALVIGAGATIVSYLFVAYVKPALKYDDSLDVFGVHGIAGIWGAMATGLFALEGVGVGTVIQNGVATGGGGGLFITGNWAQVGAQGYAVLVTIIYSGIMSFILLKLIDFTIGLRCTEDSEKMGLDLSDHAETAYTIS
jgi:Amt family ammonium transporter